MVLWLFIPKWFWSLFSPSTNNSLPDRQWLFMCCVIVLCKWELAEKVFLSQNKFTYNKKWFVHQNTPSKQEFAFVQPKQGEYSVTSLYLPQVPIAHPPSLEFQEYFWFFIPLICPLFPSLTIWAISLLLDETSLYRLNSLYNIAPQSDSSILLSNHL